MLKAALYIRVSTDDQVEYSPDAQKRQLLEYAKKNDIIVDDDYIFIDDGFSGRKAEKRPAFMRMIGTARLKPAPFDVILVHKFDRFARSREDSVVYKSLLKKDGIKVISITEHIDDDKFSIILESMLEAMAEYYSINLSEEVKKGMTEKALRGEVQSIPPYGYDVKDNIYIINPAEAETVRFIYNRILSGDTSFYRIAKELNAMGVKTKRGNKFQNRTVEYIAKNIVYAGKIVWCPDGRKDNDFDKESLIIRDGKHDPIVTMEEFERVQNILKSTPKLYRNQQPSSTHRHWLSGLLRCDSCGATLCYTGTHSPGFQCRGYSGGRCTVSHRITIKAAEEIVFASLNSIINGTAKRYHLVEKDIDNKNIERKNIEKSIERADIKLERAKNAYLDGIDDEEEYRRNKASILEEKEHLIEELRKYKVTNIDDKKFREQIRTLYGFLQSDASVEEKSDAAHQMIEKIVYNKQEERLEFYYYI